MARGVALPAIGTRVAVFAGLRRALAGEYGVFDARALLPIPDTPAEPSED